MNIDDDCVAFCVQRKMYFNPSESATCCACAQMWVNILLVLFGTYIVFLLSAWTFWLKLIGPDIDQWYNAFLTSATWLVILFFGLAVLLTIFLRFQRSTLAMVPAKARWTAVERDFNSRFEVGDLKPTRKHRRKSRTPVRTEEEEEAIEMKETTELAAAVERAVATASEVQDDVTALKAAVTAEQLEDV